jgi:hypothetical protein
LVKLIRWWEAVQTEADIADVVDITADDPISIPP